MGIYHCPRCNAEFVSGAKFCQACGCNLEQEFLEEPICPTCSKRFSAGTKFCDLDGSRLTSADKLIPKCVKCGTAYPNGTKFCPKDGGAVIADRYKNAPNNAYQPTSNTLQYPKAPLWDRFLASVIDTILLLVLHIPALIFLLVGIRVADDNNGAGIFFLFLTTILVIAPNVFILFLDGFRQGQGYGKKMFGLMVVHLPSNTPCTKGQSFLRSLIALLTCFIPVVGFLIEPLVLLIDSEGRRLGDKAAKTQVIEREFFIKNSINDLS